jgi:hypothetical protein
VERRVAIRNVGVELDGGIAAVVGVDLADGFPGAAKKEVLAVRRRAVSTAKPAAHRFPVLRFDQPRQAGPVGLLPGVPSGDPEKLPAGRDRTDLGHARQPQVARLGDEGRQEGAPVTGWATGLDMPEMPDQICPAIDLIKQIRDPDRGHHAVEAVGEPIRFRPVIRSGPTQFQLSAHHGDPIRRFHFQHGVALEKWRAF